MTFPYKFNVLSQKVKSALYGYTEWEEKADMASNNESWGPSTAQLSELASGTFHPTIRDEILRILLKKLKFRPSHWKQCQKALLCLEYIIKHGDVGAIPIIKRYVQIIRYIADHFNFTEGFEDRGKVVRAQAVLVMNILESSGAIMKERASAKSLRGKITGLGSGPTSLPGPKLNDATPEISSFSTPQDIQERDDYMLALRLQKEEEKRSGMRLSTSYSMQRKDGATSYATYPSHMTRSTRHYDKDQRSVYDMAKDTYDTPLSHDFDRFQGQQHSHSSHKLQLPSNSYTDGGNSEFKKTHIPETPLEEAPATKSKELDFSDLFKDLELSNDTKQMNGAPQSKAEAKSDASVLQKDLADLF